MQALKTRPGARRGSILYLRTEDIEPSSVQPRQVFDDEALKELSESIRSYGILNPLTLRLRGCSRPGSPGCRRSPASCWM